MESKKKRGSNYSELEKTNLIIIIEKYKHIIENKETNAVFLKKKQFVWEKIAHEYNSRAVTGPRSWLQLRHLYDNIKQKLKKTVAKENRKRYDSIDKDIDLTDEEEYNTDVSILKKKAIDDKKEIFKTGGGFYKSNLSEKDAQVLALIAPQVKPLSNPFDNGAIYFGDADINVWAEETMLTQKTPKKPLGDADINVGAGETMLTQKTLKKSDDNSNIIILENITLNKNYDMDMPIENYNINEGEIGNDLEKPNYKEQVKKPNYKEQVEKPNNKEQVNSAVTKKKQLKKKTQSIKEKYFNLKYSNAKLERKFLIQKNKREITIYKLQLQLLNKRMNLTKKK